ncbi:hypothetical protein DFQ29_000903, partial [Apophysomyces sp. BC1021]
MSPAAVRKENVQGTRKRKAPSSLGITDDVIRDELRNEINKRMNIEFVKITKSKDPTIKNMEKFKEQFVNQKRTPRGLITSSGSSDHLFKTLKEKYDVKGTHSALESRLSGKLTPLNLWNSMADTFYRKQTNKLEKLEKQTGPDKGKKRKAHDDSPSDVENEDDDGNGDDGEPSDDGESDDDEGTQEKYIRMATTSLRKIVRPGVDFDTVKSRLLATQETNSRVINGMGTVLSHFTDMVIRGDVYKFIGYSGYTTRVDLTEVLPHNFHFHDYPTMHEISSLPFQNADSVDNWDIFTFRQFQNMFYFTIGNVETQQILIERDDDAVTSPFQAHSVKELYTAANNMYQGALYQRSLTNVIRLLLRVNLAPKRRHRCIDLVKKKVDEKAARQERRKRLDSGLRRRCILSYWVKQLKKASLNGRPTRVLD